MDIHVQTEEERARVAAELQARVEELRRRDEEKARRRAQRRHPEEPDRLPYRDPE